MQQALLRRSSNIMFGEMGLHTFPSSTKRPVKTQSQPTPISSDSKTSVFQSLRCLLYIWFTVMKILCSVTSGLVLKKLLPNFNQSSILASPPHYSRSSQDALVHFLYHSWAAFLLFNRASPQLRLSIFLPVSVFLLLSFISRTHTHTHHTHLHLFFFSFFYLASSTHCEFFVCLFLCPLSSDWLWLNREPFGGGPLWIPNDDTGTSSYTSSKATFIPFNFVNFRHFSQLEPFLCCIIQLNCGPPHSQLTCDLQ